MKTVNIAPPADEISEVEDAYLIEAEELQVLSDYIHANLPVSLSGTNWHPQVRLGAVPERRDKSGRLLFKSVFLSA